MSQPENDEGQPRSDARWLSSTAYKELGRMVTQDETPTVISTSIEVEGVEPAHYAPAGARPYEGTAKRGLDIQKSANQAEQAIDYAGSLFPESNFSYLGAGRYGVVLADESGKAFKVYRSALSYSRCEKEAGALKLLSDVGLAPKLHLFVDASEEYRLDRKAYDYTKFGFEDVQIPRQNSGRELPVMVMDRVDVGPLDDAEPAKLIDGFCKVAEVFMRENIYSWDTEVMLDRKSGEVIILDVGELSQKPFDEASATPEAKLSRDQEVLRSVALDFELNEHEYQIITAYKQGGIEAVRGLLTQLLEHK